MDNYGKFFVDFLTPFFEGLIDIFKDTCTHRDTLMDEIIDVISTHKKKFIENTGIQNYLAQLNINPKSFNDIDIARGQRMKYHNYYVKPIEGTNIIQLFDIFNKQFTQITMPNCSFPTNSFFYFDRDTHICYQSGGLINKVSTNEFYEIAKARYGVFACEQKITMENDFDNVDKNSYHIFSIDTPSKPYLLK